MLPDFPGIKRKVEEDINSYMKELIRQEPFLSEFRVEHHFEGDKSLIKTEDGQTDLSNYKKLSSEVQIKIEDVITKGPQALVEPFRTMAGEIKKQKAKVVFDKLNETTTRTGRRIDTKGRPFNFESFMESMEKILIDFDEQGNPYLPTVVIPPEMVATIKEKLSEWKANPEYEKRFQELIEKKRKEWIDRESNRKLVD